ncbi:MAG: hypothetical protein U0694_29525 [Anaerolineae bacterium]
MGCRTGSRVDTISVPGSPTLAADGAAVWFYAADRSSMSVWDIASGAVVQQYTFSRRAVHQLCLHEHRSLQMRRAINVLKAGE